jgi:hypothetical protein
VHPGFYSSIVQHMASRSSAKQSPANLDTTWEDIRSWTILTSSFIEAATEHVVGQATFERSDKDFVISVGESAVFSTGHQEIARCIGNNKLFGHDGYQFSVFTSTSPRETDSTSVSLVWKHTHDSHLGSSMWRPKDFKLIDERTGEVMAVYNNLSETDSEMGKLEWKVACSTGEEMRALIVLMAMFERTRRSKKQASRAAVVSAAQGPRKGKIY